MPPRMRRHRRSRRKASLTERARCYACPGGTTPQRYPAGLLPCFFRLIIGGRSALALDHDIAGIAGCRRYQREPTGRPRRHSSANHFCARSRLAEAVPRENEPHPPLTSRWQLIGTRPEGPVIKQCPRFGGRQGGAELIPRHFRRQGKRTGPQAPHVHPPRNPPSLWHPWHRSAGAANASEMPDD